MKVTVSICGFEELRQLQDALMEYHHVLSQESVALDIQFRAKARRLDNHLPNDGTDAARHQAMQAVIRDDAQRRRTCYPPFIFPADLVHIEVSE